MSIHGCPRRRRFLVKGRKKRTPLVFCDFFENGRERISHFGCYGATFKALDLREWSRRTWRRKGVRGELKLTKKKKRAWACQLRVRLLISNIFYNSRELCFVRPSIFPFFFLVYIRLTARQFRRHPHVSSGVCHGKQAWFEHKNNTTVTAVRYVQCRRIRPGACRGQIATIFNPPAVMPVRGATSH